MYIWFLEFVFLVFAVIEETPRRQDDHGTMVFHCQPWLTMVDSVVTMVSDRGHSLTADHGSRSTMVTKYHCQVLEDIVSSIVNKTELMCLKTDKSDFHQF